jgi:hypothetical protein
MRDGEVYEFTGQLLGHGSSYHEGKVRWFVVDLYKDSAYNQFVVHTQGISTIPGEQTLVRVKTTTSAFEIVELLTVHHNKKLYLPRPSSRALAQAAHWDDDIRDAYVSRAVL